MFSELKSVLKKNPLLFKAYSYYKYGRWQPKAGSSIELLAKYLTGQNDVYFVQVGANDGVQGDFIRSFVLEKKWRGLFVEPQAEAFNKLKENYAECKFLEFENSAIAEKNGTIIIYRPAGDEYSTLASLNKDYLKSRSNNSGKALEMIEEVVPSITFNSLTEKHQIKNISLMVVDVEGYDYEIIKQIDFDNLKPSMIIYEYLHLGVEAYKNSVELLIKHGYKVYKDYRDVIAVYENHFNGK